MLFLLCATRVAFSETLAEWDIEHAGNTAAVLNIADGLSALPITATGVDPLNSGSYPGSFAASGWSTGDYDKEKYYSFTASATDGSTASISGIQLALTYGAYGGVGASNWVLKSSADEFLSELVAYELLTEVNEQHTFSNAFSAALTVHSGDSLEFRLYGYYPDTSTDYSGLVNMEPGTYGSDTITGTGSNVMLFGTIPEPMGMALIAAIAAVGWFLRRRCF